MTTPYERITGTFTVIRIDGDNGIVRTIGKHEGGDIIGITDDLLEDVDPRYLRRVEGFLTFDDGHRYRLVEHFPEPYCLWLAEKVQS